MVFVFWKYIHALSKNVADKYQFKYTADYLKSKAYLF